MNRASKRTLNNLTGVHFKLATVVGYTLATSEQDFFVNEGLRTAEKQQEYYKKGASRLDGINRKSAHQLGKAVDVYYTGWKNTDKADDARWLPLIEAFRTAGRQLGIKLVFGYDWGWDKPHVELGEEE